MAPRFSIFGWPGKQAREASKSSTRRARSRSRRQAAALGLESLEDKRVLAVTITPNFDGLGGLLIYDDASGPTANKVSLYMQDATGSSLYYTIGSGSLTTTPPVPLTGVTSIQFLDSLPDAGGTGDTLEIYGFGSSSITVSGRDLVFGGALPITTLNVENFVLDGQTSRAPMAFDGLGVTGNVTARNASVTTVAGTATYEIGGNLSIDTNTLQLAGALSARGVTSLSLSGGINQAVAAPITTATLTIVNTIAGDVLLTNSRNAVGSVAITNLAEGGNVSFTDTDSLSVGVGGVGIVANTASSVNVFSGGILGIAAPILAGSGSVYLVAANGIGQAAAAEIVAHSLTFRNGSAATTGSNNVDLPGLDNCIDIVAGINYANNGSVSINGLDGMSIGPGVDGIAGLTAFNGVISVNTGDSLSIDSDILAETTSGGSSVNGGTILLTANNGVRQSGGGRLVGRSMSVNNKASGPVALDIAANDLAFVSVINTTPNGSVAYADTNDFAVGVGGITTSGTSGAVTLVSQGTITQLGAIVTRTLSLNNQNTAGGGVLLPLATNDVAFLNAANAFAGGTIRYTDANGFGLGEAGIDAAGNEVALAAAGAISQTGDLVADSLDIRQTGGGGVNLTNATNSVSILTGSIGSGTLAVTTQTPLSLGQAGISAALATVDITTAGSLTQTGAIAAQTLTATNTSALAGDIVLDNHANAIATFTANNAFGGGLVTLVNSTGTTVGAGGILADGNDVSLSVRGSLSQAGKIVANTLTVANTSTTTGAITLDLATNDVTSFGATNAAAGASTAYRDASEFDVTGVSGQGAVSLTSVGSLTQTGAITTPGLLTATNLSGTTGSVVLANAGNRAASLAGGNANADTTTSPVFQYTDADDVLLGAAGITAPVSDVTLAAIGNLTQDATSGAIQSRSLDVSNSSTTRGVITLANTKNDTAVFSATSLFSKGAVTYTDANSVTLGSKGIAADKNAVTLNVSGNILQDVTSGSIAARSLALNNASISLGQIALANAKNDVDLLAINNAAVTATSSFTDADGMTIDTAGINAAAGAGNVVLNTSGTLEQLGSITVRELTANTTAGNILLAAPTNDVKLFNATNTNAAGTVSYTDANDVAIGSTGIAATGNNVNLTFATALAQDVTTSGAITAGTLNLATTKAAATTSLVTPTNNVATLTAKYTGTGGTLAFVDADALAIGQLTSSTIGIQATGAAVSLTAGGTGNISQTGTIQAASLNVTSNTGNIDLALAGNDVTSLSGASATGNIAYRDASALDIAATGVATSGNLALTTTGALTQAGKIVANTLTVANTSTTTGAITLDLATNDVTSFGATNAALADIVYRDASGFKINTTGISARQNIQLTSLGDITQQLTGSIVGQNLSVTNLTEQVGSDVTLGLATNNVRSFVASSESPTGGITLRTVGPLVIGVAGSGITATQGSIAVTAGGRLTLTANIDAGQDLDMAAVRSKVNLAATGGISQTAGTVVANDLAAMNNGVGEIILSASGNDVDRFAATNTGNISYTDIDSFETGILRPGVPGDQVVEVATAGTLRLQAGTSDKDALRIVGGLKFGVGKLFLSSGTASLPGTVEYVTTSTASGGPTFSGSLRDMIGYANVNQARVGTAVTPQSIVFDATGYAIDQITVSAALPAVSQRVTIDGTRVETSLAANPRVGINAASPATGGNGLLFASGASGSNVLGLAVTGFTKGAGIQLQGSRNTVTNTFLGIARDGSTLSGNQYGIDLNVAAATGNVIGGAAVDFGVPDDQLANIIGGNTVAGVMVRGGAAGNVIRGNYIGTDSSDSSLGNLGSGVQVFATANTLISENVVARNFGDGIFVNSAAATAATPNRLIANQIRNQTAAGVRVSNSAFASIGTSGAGNVIGLNNVGIQITNKSSSVTVAGNYVGTDEFEANLGNTADGISLINSINNTIGGPTIDLGNTSAFNGGTGVAVRNSFAPSSAVGNRVLSNTADRNSAHGILIDGGSQNTIGGVSAGNIATRNGGDGIRVQSFISGTTRFVSSGNQILGNLAGTDSRVGNVDLGNLGDGIAIVEGSANVVSQGNVSRFNALSGLRVEGSSANIVGSDVAGEGNTFSDNLVNGITVTGGMANALSRGNRLSGNVIQSNGTDPGSSTTGAGILVTGSRTTETAIGTRVANGRLVGVPNQIFENLGFGVSVVNGAQNTQIQSNTIYDNRLGAINRGVATNANVSSPVLRTATVRQSAGSAPQIVVTGVVTGTPRQQLAIDVYATPTGEVDAALPIGGRIHLGRFTVTITNVSGTTFTASLPMLTLVAGDQITATATTLTQASGSNAVATPIGSTSAMSAAIQLLLPTTTPTTAPINRTRRA